MEVTHKDDHVTHAVVGGSEKIDYTIADGGFFMQMLSASLYKDQKLALIRETLCNADDAHKMVNQTKPFEVTLTAEKLIIRDFGPGIPHDQIGPIYATYGGSTKQNDDGQTGGFGLGCKAPFAYTDNFQVTSFCNGTKTVYRMSKSDSEVGGKPSIIKIVSVPTQESGLEVSINIAQPSDVHQFSTRIVQVLANGEMNAIFNGNQARVLPFSKMEKGYLITSERPLHNSTETIFVRYGAVIYPVEENDFFRYEHRNVQQRISQLGREENTDFYLILQAAPGSLSLTPSREGLTITEKTNETVKGLLEEFYKNYISDYENEVVTTYHKAVNDAADNADVDMLLSGPHELKLQKKYIERPTDSEGNAYIVNPLTLARWSLLHRYPGVHDQDFAFRDLRKRAQLLINCPTFTGDRGLLRTFYSALKGQKYRLAGQAAYRVFRKRVVVPVMEVFYKNKKTTLDIHRLHLAIPYNGWQERSSYYRRDRIYFRGASHVAINEADKLFMMQRRVIVLTHAINDFEDKLSYSNAEERNATPGYSELGDKNDRLFGALVYEVGRAKSKVDEARALLGNLKGYTFVDMTKVLEYREPKARAPAAPKEKPVGYPTLTGVTVRKEGAKERYFDWQLMASTGGRVEKPIGFVELYGKTHHLGRDHLVGLDNPEHARIISDIYGDVVTVVMTDAQRENLKKKGIYPESVWIPLQIQKELEDPELLSALPGTSRVLRRWLSKQDDVDGGFVTMVLNSEELCGIFKLPQLKSLNFNHLNTMRMFHTFGPKYKELVSSEIGTRVEQMEPHAQVQKFVKKLVGNKMLAMIDPAAVRVALEGSDADLKAKAIKLIKQVIKG